MHAAYTRSMSDTNAQMVVRERAWGEGLFSPLSWAAYVTWAAITVDALDFEVLRGGVAREWLGALALLAYIGLFATRAVLDRRFPSGAWPTTLVILQALAALTAALFLKSGIVGILLVIVAAQLVAIVSLARTIALLAVFNTALVWIWSQSVGLPDAVLALFPILGFQAFAALTGLYAVRAERAREALMLAHGELLATRELLSESTRSEERLRLSRELHDVAGHKLTALKLNLSRLARDPALGAREEVRVSTLLATELLEDIRAVVSELRRHDGVDLSAALKALAQSIPGVRIDIEVDADSRLAAIGHAETLLRCAQEALTNALRHGSPTRILVHCQRSDAAIELMVVDNGSHGTNIRFGNGLNGMRERLEGVGGALAVSAVPTGGVRLIASLPA